MILRLIFLISLILSKHAFSASRVVIALSATPSQLSPFFATDASSQNLNRLLHLSLTDFESDMSFGCRLCTAFTERFEDEKHIIHFKLKDDVTFWDGKKVRAEDVRSSWKLFTDEEIKSNHRFAFKNIEDVKVISESEVEIRYKSFSLENLSNLSLLKIVKVEQEESGKAIELSNIIGAGPYELTGNTSFEIILNPRDKKKPVLEFKVVRDETTLALKLINGEIDLALSAISPRKINWLRERKNDLKFWETAGATYIYLGINHRSQHMQNVKVRKAISHLLPREEVLKHKLRGTAQLATGLFSKVFAGMYLDTKHDEYKPLKAAQLLEEAGYKKNEKGEWQINGNTIVLDWKVSNNKSVIEVVEVFKSYLNQNGIKVNITIQEWGTFMRSVRNGSFDLVMSQWVGFTGPDMLNFVFHSESVPPNGANRGYFLNTEMDSLLNLAKAERDEVKRTGLYREASKLAVDHYAYINLWHPNIIWIGKKCLSLEEIHSNGSYYPLLNLETKCESK